MADVTSLVRSEEDNIFRWGYELSKGVDVYLEFWLVKETSYGIFYAELKSSLVIIGGEVAVYDAFNHNDVRHFCFVIHRVEDR